MIVLTKTDIPTIGGDDLESEWRKAKERFEQILAQKIETDRIYVTAATHLNILERQVKKVERQAEIARREAHKSLLLRV